MTDRRERIGRLVVDVDLSNSDVEEITSAIESTKFHAERATPMRIDVYRSVVLGGSND